MVNVTMTFDPVTVAMLEFQAKQRGVTVEEFTQMLISAGFSGLLAFDRPSEGGVSGPKKH